MKKEINTWVRSLFFGLILLVSCGGGAPEDVSGVYDGQWTRLETQGDFTYMNEDDHLVFIAPARDGGIAIELRDECSVVAQLPADGLIDLDGTSCLFESDALDLTVNINGEGTVSDDGTLVLEYTASGTIRRSPEPSLSFSSTNTFRGTRQ